MVAKFGEKKQKKNHTAFSHPHCQMSAERSKPSSYLDSERETQNKCNNMTTAGVQRQFVN